MDVSDKNPWEKRMEWERNAAQEIKEKGEGDIESMLKFITSWEDTKKLLAAERVVEKQLVAVEPLQVVSFVVPHDE